MDVLSGKIKQKRVLTSIDNAKSLFIKDSFTTDEMFIKDKLSKEGQNKFIVLIVLFIYNTLLIEYSKAMTFYYINTYSIRGQPVVGVQQGDEEGAEARAEGGGRKRSGKKNKNKKQKGGFLNLEYDTQKMYNAQGLITELNNLNAPNLNVNLNQPDPFSASGNSTASSSFETLPPEMLAGLTPSLSGGAKKKKNNLKPKRI